ncbi:hypothetical protein [Actinoplanes sp. ATCC 53533]|uniref:hypothetical protein n=1 Tax=Actinoplanes sp. ATCC 53533 TaxID=1288362 RepID=UPI000F790D01|nr:hypothetical protein [Actinoplanes sp. ATCC 53533]
MTALTTARGAILMVVSAVLAPIAGLIAWKVRRRPTPIEGPAMSAAEDDRLAQWGDNLDREFWAAADAVSAIPSGTIADQHNPRAVARLATAVNPIHHWLTQPRGYDELQATAEIMRRLGRSAIQVQAAALAAARHPDDALLAAVLSASMTDLEQTVHDAASASP